MTDTWKAEMERRQEARRALIKGCGNPAGGAVSRLAREHWEGRTGALPALPSSSRSTAPRPRTERQQLLDAGLHFTVAEQDREKAAAAHRERRRIAEQEVTQREGIHSKLTDWYGPDYADEWMRGQ